MSFKINCVDIFLTKLHFWQCALFFIDKIVTAY